MATPPYQHKYVQARAEQEQTESFVNTSNSACQPMKLPQDPPLTALIFRQRFMQLLECDGLSLGIQSALSPLVLYDSEEGAHLLRAGVGRVRWRICALATVIVI